MADDSPSQKRHTTRKSKSSDPDYQQVGPYIPKKLYREVKKLLTDRDNLDFSELVTELLIEWVAEQKPK